MFAVGWGGCGAMKWEVRQQQQLHVALFRVTWGAKAASAATNRKRRHVKPSFAVELFHFLSPHIQRTTCQESITLAYFRVADEADEAEDGVEEVEAVREEVIAVEVEVETASLAGSLGMCKPDALCDWVEMVVGAVLARELAIRRPIVPPGWSSDRNRR